LYISWCGATMPLEPLFSPGARFRDEFFNSMWTVLHTLANGSFPSALIRPSSWVSGAEHVHGLHGVGEGGHRPVMLAMLHGAAFPHQL